jgi:hypothetical protein
MANENRLVIHLGPGSDFDSVMYEIRRLNGIKEADFADRVLPQDRQNAFTRTAKSYDIINADPKDGADLTSLRQQISAIYGVSSIE